MEKHFVISLFIVILGTAMTVRARTISLNRIGGVEISTNETHWKCNTIYCPEDTLRCHVLRQKSPYNESIVVTKSTCYDKSNRVLNQFLEEDDFNPYVHQILDINSYKNGGSSISSVSSSFSSTSFSNNANINTQDLNSNVLGHLNLNLRNLNNIGLDAEKLTKQINDNVGLHLRNMHKHMENVFGNWI